MMLYEVGCIVKEVQPKNGVKISLEEAQALVDGFTMRPCSYTFYSSMSDDELDDTFTQVEDRLGFLKNLNSK